MTIENDLNSIDNLLMESFNELKARDERAAALNTQIAAMRLEIARLNDEKYQVKQKIRSIEKDKESIQRRIELEKEAALIQKSLEEKRAEAEAILATAPWKDIAKPFQIEGALQLPDRGLLGDKRGLGKTLSSLIWRRLKGSKKTLVCLRKEVASDFIKEIGIREPGLFVYSLLGATPATRKMAAMLLNHQEEFVVVTNIESWRRDIEATTDDILRIEYDAVILDEAHHIKNFKTGTAKGFIRLAERIPKVLELTGTPIKNKPQEMFSLLHALYPDQFPRETLFLFDYCVQISQNRWVFSPTGLKSLVAKISHFYVARTPEDIGREIPPPRMIEYKLDMEQHPKQKEAYKNMTEMSLAILDTGKVVPIISQLAVMTRQAQVVSWPAGINFEIKDEFGEVIEVVKFDIHESVKMDWAEDLLKELVEEGERVVLFSRFKPAIYELKRRLELAELPVAVITGDEKGKNNTELIFDDFDLKTAPANPRWPILLATYQTVGESANLNAARHMILYDRFWNPGNDDQAIGRIDRLNSTDQATVHLPQVENTIDDYMVELIDTKRSIVSDFKNESQQQASLVNHLRKSL
jgi:non-specific serine/threonine protein kinase